MNRNNIVKKCLLGVLFILGLSITMQGQSSALTLNDTCNDVEIIFARGSGDGEEDGGESRKFVEQISGRIKSPLKSHSYLLGIEAYGGNQYPHVSVSEGFMTSLGAFVGAGHFFDYGASVQEGIGEFTSYMTQRHAKCKSSGSLYIIGGYSQGAQVIGQSLRDLTPEVRNDIVYVGLFGDPKLYLPEGDGLFPPACRGEGYSPWRRSVDNCWLTQGSLVARRPYLPTDMEHKTHLWCYARDMVCDLDALPFRDGHQKYKDEGGAIDHAAAEAVGILKARLMDRPTPPPPPLPFPDIPTRPPIDYDRAIDTHYTGKEGTSGENTVLAVDVSTSMRLKFPAIRQLIRDTVTQVNARGGKISIVFYVGVKDRNGDIKDNNGMILPFGTSPERIFELVDQLLLDDEHYSFPPGSPLLTLGKIFKSLEWTPGATKSVTLLTNNPLLDPDFVGMTTDEIAKMSLEIDPVNIYPVVPEEHAHAYTDLAAKTSGQVVTYAENSTIADAAKKAYDKITERPVPFLKNTEYLAEPGQQITFDASDSYAVGQSSITTYEWDYDGDGQFEKTTTTPSVSHTYTTAFTGYMQVRVSAGNGTVANMSAKVHVGALTPPVLPDPVQNLTYTITETVDKKSKVTINWQAGARPDVWFVRINDIPAGSVEATRSSLEITDVQRTADVTVSIARARGADNTTRAVISEFKTVTIPAIPTTPPPPPPVVSTCTQPNIFLRFVCQAIALFKQWIGGILVYILPYRI